MCPCGVSFDVKDGRKTKVIQIDYEQDSCGRKLN